jgi:hypothetical protein
MSDFDLYILKKYLFIPLLVLCVPIRWGPALQCNIPVSLKLNQLTPTDKKPFSLDYWSLPPGKVGILCGFKIYIYIY